MPFGFAGGLKDDDTDLVCFGYRDYDPEVGRWTARDPIGFEGGDINLYRYVLGDPINWVDIDGLAPAWAGPITAVTAAVERDAFTKTCPDSI
ncbi:RHS repeat-associated core domain-containing protein [Cellvibrio japonicus]|uniref:RHS repeat-associated core domain-containing protein n=1 Tax=Cellvibrio japonicus TaxID=155077 RepID=UPI000A05E65B|nr:RHS repeat-associated core domain-containing protein [Cellvibrio japonicus]QEI17614.1 RHS repeat-associated core domain-containing protein [Cellvibrio japonicus]QEI21189.1 RHS repeat-associated core domain-containing protein [Cellvibrio japonicus]